MRAVKLLIPTLALLAACSDPASKSQAQDVGLVQPTKAPPASVESMKTSFAPVVKKAAPAVVNVSSRRVVRQRVDPFWDLFTGGGVPQERIAQSLGSGAIVRADGVILTNNHNIDGADEIVVQLADRREFPARVLLADARADLAVLKIDTGGERLPVIAIDDQETLEVGDLVLAIGNPFGVGQTVTNGIVSATARSNVGITDYSFFIQTDAAINPGNSGGPLLNLRGEVIGVNSQIESRTGSFAGIGFAIPSNLVQNVARQLIEQGYVQYSYLGIQGGDVSLRMIEALNLPANLRGVVVSQALGGGPAARAGLQNAGDLVEVDGLRVPRQVDVITAINGQPLRGIADLIAYLAKNTRPGDDVTLTVLRNGSETLTLTVRLTPRPA